MGSFDEKLSSFAKKLRKSKDITWDISWFKDECRREEISKYARRLPEVIPDSNLIFGRHQISQISDLRRQVTRWLLKPEKALLWGGAEIRLNAALVSEFVELEKKFEWSLISGDLGKQENPLTFLREFSEPRGFLILGRESELASDPRRRAARKALNHAFHGHIEMRTYRCACAQHSVELGGFR